MHTYRKSGDEWTVGYCIPGSGEAGLPWWQTIRDFQSEAEAAAYVSFLNGGKDPYLQNSRETVTAKRWPR